MTKQSITKAWVYVQENHLDQAEWFCKVGKFMIYLELPPI